MISAHSTGEEPWRPPPEPLRLTIEVPATVRRGEPVSYRVALTNAGKLPVLVHTAGRAEHGLWHELVVSTPAGVVVWSPRLVALPPGVFAVDIAAEWERSLSPGQSLTAERSWDQRDLHRRLVPPGVYRVRAVITLGEPPRGTPEFEAISEPRELEIVP